jgi:O-acetyl-ADP-ribose deacetylase (regulator of RNase III)
MSSGALVRSFGPISAALVQGDIAGRTADALVNAANDRLMMGGGVAAALRSRGGIEIHEEAIQHAPKPPGSVVRTGAGKLAARFVYHAVVIDYETRGGTSEADVRVVVLELVRRSLEDSVRSMALPLFGAGVGGLGAEQSLLAILDALEEAGSFGAADDWRLRVEIVVLEDDVFAATSATFREHKPRRARQQEEAQLAEEFLRQLATDPRRRGPAE